MFKNIIGFILIAAVGLAIWRLWGADGNLDVLFTTIWDVFYTVVDAVASALITAWNAVFHGGGK